jgi:hypothetical protein
MWRTILEITGNHEETLTILVGVLASIWNGNLPISSPNYNSLNDSGCSNFVIDLSSDE